MCAAPIAHPHVALPALVHKHRHQACTLFATQRPRSPPMPEHVRAFMVLLQMQHCIRNFPCIACPAVGVLDVGACAFEEAPLVPLVAGARLPLLPANVTELGFADASNEKSVNVFATSRGSPKLTSCDCTRYLARPFCGSQSTAATPPLSPWPRAPLFLRAPCRNQRGTLTCT